MPRSSRNADLCDANLYGTALRNADLIGANLRGANLTGADLRGACLTGADIQDAIGIVSFGPCPGSGRIGYVVASDTGPMVMLGCFWGTVDKKEKRQFTRNTTAKRQTLISRSSMRPFEC